MSNMSIRYTINHKYKTIESYLLDTNSSSVVCTRMLGSKTKPHRLKRRESDDCPISKSSLFVSFQKQGIHRSKNMTFCYDHVYYTAFSIRPSFLEETFCNTCLLS